MYFPTSTILVAASLIGSSIAVTYAPISKTCPAKTALVRSATGLSHGENSFRVSRKVKADKALRSWLSTTNAKFDTSGELPTIALTSSGGGFRAMLSGAGMVQALDCREKTSLSTSGLYQALTYHSGLSGGSWLLSSIMAHDFPTISTLLNQWKPALANGLFNPEGNQTREYADINNDLAAKTAAGFQTTVADAWARLLSYDTLPGPNGGVDNLLSQIVDKSKFKSRDTPYPIILALHVDLTSPTGLCVPPADAPTWEFTPYEMGSWDTSIATFTPSKYLGTTLSNGKSSSNTCINNHDNLGFVLGTSSTLFNDPGLGTGAPAPLLQNFCQLTVTLPPNELGDTLSRNILSLPGAMPSIQLASPADLFSNWPNPFYNLTSAPAVSAQKTLSMVDGGDSGQINPIFPMLQPERDVKVIIVSDSTGGTADGYPSGAELRLTYLAALNAGLTRMPFIPETGVFVAQNLTDAPVFFGCNDKTKSTLVWVPNGPATAAGGNTSTSQMQYTTTQTQNVVANGKAVMSQNDSSAWATCLACAIMENGTKALPKACKTCFEKYCFAA